MIANGVLKSPEISSLLHYLAEAFHCRKHDENKGIEMVCSKTWIEDRCRDVDLCSFDSFS